MTSQISSDPGKATRNVSASTPAAQSLSAARSPSAGQLPSTGGRRGSFHLLPVLALALGLVLTIRVGDVWLGLTVGVGTETLAQAAPADAPAADSMADPAEPAVESASTEGTPPAEPDVAEPAPQAPIDFTDEEVEVLQQLAKRREELDLRARQLDEREAMVAAAEQRMEQKMVELRALQTVVEDLLKAQSEAEEEQLQSLVKIYQNMKPKDAAQVFEELDLDVLLQVVARMNERKLAPILGLVSPTRAKEVTYELVQRQTLPFTP
ncbi:MAG: hypothetical protein JNL25_07380 [Rhodospirillaceae bacterium]|nr:hypothetical protein [Rhodospirillaceae bacterium]